MTNAYVPIEGSTPAIVIQYLQDHPEESPLSAERVAQLCGIKESSVSSTLQRPCKEGVLARVKEGREYVYSLPVEPEPEPEIPFMAALDSQGELYCRGVQIDDNGGVLFTKEKADALIAYLARWSTPAAAA